GRRRVPPLPVDHAAGANTVGSARAVEAALTREETGQLLHEVPDVYRTQVNDVLLAALAGVLAEWTGGERGLVALGGRGGGEVAAPWEGRRPVGGSPSLSPLLRNLGGLAGGGGRLRGVKEQLRGVPGNGLGYGLLRYLGGDPELAAALRS